MTTTSKIAAEIIYVAINVGMAKYHAYLFDKKHIEPDKHFHRRWANIYGSVVTISFIYRLIFQPFSFLAIWLWLSALAIHFPLFSTALNRSRTPPRPWFYHNTTDPNGSKWDLWLGKYYIPVWFGCVVAWVFLQWLIFR